MVPPVEHTVPLSPSGVWTSLPTITDEVVMEGDVILSLGCSVSSLLIVLWVLWITVGAVVTQSPNYLFSGCKVFHHSASALYRHPEAAFSEKQPCLWKKKQFLASGTVQRFSVKRYTGCVCG